MSEEEEVSAQDLLKGLKRELKSLKQNSQILSRFIKQEGNTRAKATRVRNAGEAFVKTKESFKKLIRLHDDWLSNIQESYEDEGFEPSVFNKTSMDKLEEDTETLLVAAKERFKEFNEQNPDIELDLDFLGAEKHDEVEVDAENATEEPPRLRFVKAQIEEIKENIEKSINDLKSDAESADKRDSVNGLVARGEQLINRLEEGMIYKLFEELFILEGESENYNSLKAWRKEQKDSIERVMVTIAAKRAAEDSSLQRSSGSSTTSSSTPRHQNHLSLKKSDPPKFSGNIVDWPEFERKWAAQVHNLGLPEDTELDKLKENLPSEGKNMLYTVLDLSEAWRLLRGYYGDHGLIAEELKSKLKNMKLKSKEGFNKVIELRNEVKQLTARLTQVGYQDALIYDTQFRATMFKLLPAPEQREWSMFDTSSYPNAWKAFESFLETIYTHAEKSRIEHAVLSGGGVNKDPEKESSKCHWCQKPGHFIRDCKTRLEGKPKVIVNVTNVKEDPKDTEKFKNLKDKIGKCPVCQEFHTWDRKDKKNFPSSKLRACPKFMGLTVKARARKLEEIGGCPQCSCWDHKKDKCYLSNPVCGMDDGNGNKCSEKHSRIFHDSGSVYCNTVNLEIGEQQESVLLVEDIKVGKSMARTMYDNACNRVLITHSYAEKEGMKSRSITYELKVVGQDWVTKEGEIYEFTVTDRLGKKEHVWAFGIDSITEVLKPVDLRPCRRYFPHLPNEVFEPLDPKPVDLLIGTNYLSLHPKNTADERDEVGNLVAFKTRFGDTGWLVAGSHPDLKVVSSEARAMSCMVNRVFIKAEMADRFFEAENLGVMPPRKCLKCRSCAEKGQCSESVQMMSIKEDHEYEMLRKNVIVKEDEKIAVVSYPFIKNPDCLQDNRNKVTRMAERLWRKLKRDKLLTKYNEEFGKFLNRGAIVELNEDELKSWPGAVNFISHHAVLKESVSTPLRIVSNPSIDNGGFSLNSCLPKGPKALNDLFSVLLRFRCREVGLAFDLSKAYQTIRTTEVEKHLRRLIWRFDDDEDWRVFAFDRLQFGDRPAACFLMLVIKHLAEIGREIDEEAAAKLEEDCYVDDFLTGGSEAQVERFVGKKKGDGSYDGTFTQILDKGGFKVKTFVRSHETDKEAMDKLGGKVLGYGWKADEDIMTVNLFNEEVTDELILTKRGILSFIMKIYDPLGVTAPLIIKYKLGMKEIILHRSKEQEKPLSWNEEVPDEFKDKWKKYIKEAAAQGEVKFPRGVHPKGAEGPPIIVGYWDGSSRAYAAVIYIVWEMYDGENMVSFMCSKAKVTPAKGLTIPKSEMNSLVLCSRLMKTVVTSMPEKPSLVLLVGDSECVIHSLEKGTALGPFFYNRLMEIEENKSAIEKYTKVEEVHHCRSGDNGADIATRDKADMKTLELDGEWLAGPNYLKQPRSDWPFSREFLKKDLPSEEMRNKLEIFFTVAADKPEPRMPELYKTVREVMNYSEDIKKVGRILAMILGGWKEVKRRESSLDKNNEQDVNMVKSFLNHENLIRAMKIMILSGMQETKKALDEGRLDCLLPRRDEGMIVTQGRLGEKGLQQILGVSKLPILMKDSRVAHLIMQAAHTEETGLNHRGVSDTLARSRAQAWIINGKNLAKRIRNQCLICRAKEKRLKSQQMAEIKADQLQVCRPWTNISLDYAGPFLIKGMVNTRAKKKVWVGVYVCRNTKAVAFTLMAGYDTKSFLMQHSKFIYEHGVPDKVVTDRGTSLVKAGQALAKNEGPGAWDWAKITRDNVASSWEFVPVGCQWRAGLAESQVKSLKKALDLAMFGNDLDYAEFSTLLAKIAYTMNSRPLDIAREGLKSSLDTELQPITPNQILLARSSNSSPVPEYSCDDKVLTRLAYVQKVEKAWWDKWIKSVFPTLLPNNKWRNEERNLNVGDVVMIKFPRLKVAEYKLGRVVKVHPDRKGLVRSVTVNHRVNDAREGNQVCKPRLKQEIMGVQRLVCLLPAEEQ